MRPTGPISLLALALTALAADRLAGATKPSAPIHLVWPPAPDEPRVQFVRSFSKPADVGIEGSTFGRLANWVTGADRSRESLVNPVAVAVDDTGGLCVADTGTRRISFYEPAARRWRHWDQAGGLAFQTPVALAKRGDTIFVSDAGLGMVVAFNIAGKLLFRIDHDFRRPCGLALLNDRLYVTDVEGHRVVVFDLQGNRRSAFGQRGEGPGDFNFPTHAATAQGLLLVTDSLNSRVQVFDAEGRFQNSIGAPGDTSGHFGRPKGVAADGFGHVYVVDAVFDNLQVFDLKGRLLLNLGVSGSGPGQFGLPNGIAISPDNHIYVADSTNHRVQEFRYIGPP